MTAGIGVVVLLGVGTYTAIHYGLDLPKRERGKKREHLIQEVINLHHKAISALAEDMGLLAIRLEELASKSDTNSIKLGSLKSEVGLLRSALENLKERESAICLPKPMEN